jgi:lysozyme
VISDAIVLSRDALVKPFEGCARRLPDGRCAAYPDPGTGREPWTIWWGSTGPDVKQDTVWDEAQGQAALEQELLFCASKAIQLSPRLAHEPDRRLAAIISFLYNCGSGNYRISTLKKRVDAGDWSGAKDEIVKWNKASGRVLAGLTRRRLAEASFL